MIASAPLRQLEDAAQRAPVRDPQHRRVGDVALVAPVAGGDHERRVVLGNQAIETASDLPMNGNDRRNTGDAPAVDDRDASALVPQPAARGGQYRCSTCRLARTAPDVVQLIHQLAGQRPPLGGRAILARVAPVMRSRGINPPHASSIDRHIELHADLPAHAAATSTSASGERQAEPSSSSRPEDKDYARYEDLFGRVLGKLEMLERDPTTFVADDGRVDLYRLCQWTGLINSARGALDSLGRARSSDRFVTAFAMEVIRTFIGNLTEVLAPWVGEINQLAMSGGAIDVVVRLERAEDDLNAMFVATANAAMAEEVERFKLVLTAREAMRRPSAPKFAKPRPAADDH